MIQEIKYSPPTRIVGGDICYLVNVTSNNQSRSGVVISPDQNIEHYKEAEKQAIEALQLTNPLSPILLIMLDAMSELPRYKEELAKPLSQVNRDKITELCKNIGIPTINLDDKTNAHGLLLVYFFEKGLKA